MQTVRILHASDLHIAETPNLIAVNDHKLSAGLSLSAIRRTAWVSSYNRSLLLALAKFINDDYQDHIDGLGATLDALVFTGDISTTGRKPDLGRAQRFFEDPYHEFIPSQLAATPGEACISKVVQHDDCTCRYPVRVMALPGNHDRLEPALFTLYSPGGTQFDSYMARNWKGSLSLKPHGDDVRSFEIVRDGLRVVVAGADFNLKSAADRHGRWWNRYAQGRVYNTMRHDILDQLVAATPSAEDAVTLWAIHFPPDFPGIADTMMLVDDDSLIDEANRLGVTAVLAGHTHHQTRYRRPRMNFEVLCAGTATQHKSVGGHFFEVVEVSGESVADAVVHIEHYEYDGVGSYVQV